MKKRLEKLRTWIQSIEAPVATGFSGGVDSSFLLAALLRWYRYPVRPFCLISPFFSSSERLCLKKISAEIGIRPYYIKWNPLAIKTIRENNYRRCFFCKRQMYHIMLVTGRKFGVENILDGTQADDLERDRPGLKALDELNIRTPLSDCGLRKKELRQILKQWGYSFWNMASESCLATRIEQDTELSKENLRLIDQLEDFCSIKDINFQKISVIDRSIYIFIHSDEIDRIKMYFNEMERIGERFRIFLKY